MTLKLAVNTRDTPHHDWNRPSGRPQTTWMSQIVQDSGLSADDAWAVAEDRPTVPPMELSLLGAKVRGNESSIIPGRALRPTAGYAQQ